MSDVSSILALLKQVASRSQGPRDQDQDDPYSAVMADPSEGLDWGGLGEMAPQQDDLHSYIQKKTGAMGSQDELMRLLHQYLSEGGGPPSPNHRGGY